MVPGEYCPPAGTDAMLLINGADVNGGEDLNAGGGTAVDAVGVVSGQPAYAQVNRLIVLIVFWNALAGPFTSNTSGAPPLAAPPTPLSVRAVSVPVLTPLPPGPSTPGAVCTTPPTFTPTFPFAEVTRTMLPVVTIGAFSAISEPMVIPAQHLDVSE